MIHQRNQQPLFPAGDSSMKTKGPVQSPISCNKPQFRSGIARNVRLLIGVRGIRMSLEMDRCALVTRLVGWILVGWGFSIFLEIGCGDLIVDFSFDRLIVGGRWLGPWMEHRLGLCLPGSAVPGLIYQVRNLRILQRDHQVFQALFFSRNLHKDHQVCGLD